MLTLTDTAILVGTLTGVFALLCALADYAIPSAILLRRRRRAERKARVRHDRQLAPLMSEEYR